MHMWPPACASHQACTWPLACVQGDKFGTSSVQQQHQPPPSRPCPPPRVSQTCAHAAAPCSPPPAPPPEAGPCCGWQTGRSGGRCRPAGRQVQRGTTSAQHVCAWTHSSHDTRYVCHITSTQQQQAAGQWGPCSMASHSARHTAMASALQAARAALQAAPGRPVQPGPCRCAP